MEDRPVTTPRRPDDPPGFAADEGGMVSLASLIVVLVFLVLFGLVGNVGQAVIGSLEAQNAADSAAVSAGVVVARGLNAATAANHLMGELTALLVVADAFCGPEDIPAARQETAESVAFNRALDVLGPIAPWSTPGTVVATAGKLREIDRRLVDRLNEMMTKDGGKHRSGAAVYDARLTLKYLTCQGYAAKILANAIGTLGYATLFFSAAGEALAAAIHIGVDLVLVKVGQEWIFLDGVEVGATALREALGASVPPVVSALGLYGDSVAGTGVLPSPVAAAAEEALEAVREAHAMTAAASHPAPDRLRPPLRPEPPPDPAAGGARGRSPSLWSGEDWSGPGKEMDRLYKVVKDWVEDWNDFVGDFLDQDFVPDWAKDKVEKIAEAPEFPDGPVRSGGADRGLGFPGNPSLKELAEIPWEAEARSQWVRATYPHVDVLRQPAREAFHLAFGMSNASTYYVNWTNRYTLDRSHALREGSTGPHMLVLVDMEPERKGDEPWTADPDRAEDLFSLMGLVHREGRPAAFSPRIYANPGLRNGGDVAFAEALVYNANGRRMDDARPRTVQPDTGWDTLNWTPPVAAPEWGADPTGGRGGESASALAGALELPSRLFEAFTGSETRPTNRIRLNWQAKLVTASPRRLRQALAAGTGGDDAFPDVAARRLRKLLEFLPELGRH